MAACELNYSFKLHADSADQPDNSDFFYFSPRIDIHSYVYKNESIIILNSYIIVCYPMLIS